MFYPEKKIRIYGHKGDFEPTKEYHFLYTQLNNQTPDQYGPGFAKSLLTEIHEVRGDGSEILKKTKFAYNDDYSQVDNLEFPYGALHTVTNSLGSQTKYYTRKYSDFDFYKHWQRPTTRQIAYGTKDQGEEFLVLYRENKNYVYVFDWDGSQWQESIRKKDSIPGFFGCKVLAGHNYFMILKDAGGGDDAADTIHVYRWDSKERTWCKRYFRFSIPTPIPFPVTVDTAYAGYDFFAVRGFGKTALWLVHWDGVDWQHDPVYTGKYFPDSIDNVVIGNQTVAVITNHNGVKRNKMVLLRKRSNKEWYQQEEEFGSTDDVEVKFAWHPTTDPEGDTPITYTLYRYKHGQSNDWSESNMGTDTTLTTSYTTGTTVSWYIVASDTANVKSASNVKTFRTRKEYPR